MWFSWLILAKSQFYCSCNTEEKLMIYTIKFCSVYILYIERHIILCIWETIHLSSCSPPILLCHYIWTYIVRKNNKQLTGCTHAALSSSHAHLEDSDSLKGVTVKANGWMAGRWHFPSCGNMCWSKNFSSFPGTYPQSCLTFFKFSKLFSNMTFSFFLFRLSKIALPLSTNI